uniref:Major facilitator superfamily (MFS) profile domain-containing protein n=1 Tax=Globisporangium ultimum (strain ATCC 200006 / CBS 805.95 / DAOM BR144) TaxID=431595 RepID=K3WMU3_GLOUD
MTSLNRQAAYAQQPEERELIRRYGSVAAGVLLMIAVGSNHAISAWNAQLKAELDYSQAEISMVCSMASFGAYFSVSPGYVFDHIGAHKSVLLGAFLLCSIFLGLYAGIVEYPRSMHPLGVGVAFAIMGQATNFGVFAALGPNEGLFGDKNRGKIMALQLAAFSAGGALFALVYNLYFDQNVPGYFQFMAMLMLVVFLFSWFALYRDPAYEGDSAEGVHKSAMDEFMPPESDDDDDATEDKLEENQLRPIAHSTTDITGKALLTDSRFWLLFSTVFILVGSSLFVMANIAFIVESLGGPMEQVPIMVALFSVGNCCGRLVGGIVSDHVLARCPRIYFVSLASVLVACIHTLFLVLPAAYLVVPITMSGVADGVMFAAFPVLTRETFGARHFGKNFGMMSVANAIGFPLFYNPLGSFFYRLSSTSVDSVEKCFGLQCFRPVFLLVVGLSCVAFAASLKFAARQKYLPLR